MRLVLHPSYPTSIITRIETIRYNLTKTIVHNFLPHFHYNKDWNPKGAYHVCLYVYFLPHFHYNKDWNPDRPRRYALSGNFLPHFHYNKDWNN